MALRNTSGPKFDGEGDIEEFLTEFGYESEMYGWDPEAQARVIKFFLKGKALSVYKALDDNKKTDIKEVEKALREKCVLSPDVYLNQFYQRTLYPERKSVYIAEHLA